ncbi:transcription elongation factor elongin A [Musca autumnalis]|uniref:transcription elongation factor elongin A n=1 Tax=Musca autumnalis TaxID=221902 RepID=UPI003CE984E4
MTTSIVEVIQHYQRSIDNSQDNEARLLHCINKLYKLPIKVEHLQETGVGKTVNSLRKFNGEIGVAAKSLVTKWKAMVAAEEEPMDTTPQTYDNESQHHNDNDEPDPSPNNNMNEDHNSHSSRHSSHSHEKDKHKDRSHSSSSNNNTPHKESSKHASSSSKHHKSSSSNRDKESHHHKSSSSSSSSKDREKEKGEHKSKDKHKDKHQEKERENSEKRKEEKHKSEKETKLESTNHKDNSSSSSKDKTEEKHSHKSSSKDRDGTNEKEKHKDRSEKHHKSSSKDKHKDKNKEKSKESSSSSKDKHKASSSSSTKDSTESRKRHNSDTESSDFKSPLPKIAKTSHKSSGKAAESVSPPQDTADDDEDCFDSTMGTNFDDILGMLDKPVKKGKKSKTSSSVSSSSSGGGSKESPPKPSTSNQRKNGIISTPPPYSPMSTPSKLPTAKPDLLAPTAKLAPLDPSIALELPTISTNYRPMPLNQTVMDCVFNTSSSSSSRSAPVRTLSDAEALQHGISSKTIRTKIYSGTKTGQIYQVPSLFDMCIRILQKNIDALEYTGGVPFEVLRPVLERATPQQLFIFEDYNPYLMEDSDVLWQVHVSRNYRTQKRLENESWREMFMRCQEDEERRLSFLKDSIKASQKIAAAPVRKTQLAFVDSMVKPPRNVQRKQEQYGTQSKMVATPAARVAALQSVTPNAAKTGDQRLKVPSTVRDHAQVSHSSVRPKKAPLMQKTLAFIRGRLKR